MDEDTTHGMTFSSYQSHFRPSVCFQTRMNDTRKGLCLLFSPRGITPFKYVTRPPVCSLTVWKGPQEPEQKFIGSTHMTHSVFIVYTHLRPGLVCHTGSRHSIHCALLHSLRCFTLCVRSIAGELGGPPCDLRHPPVGLTLHCVR